MHPLKAAISVCALALVAGCISTPRESQPLPTAPTRGFEASVSFVSEGDTVRGMLHVADGAGPHPTLLFLSGFGSPPARPHVVAAITGAGYNVLRFSYRGSYDSDGTFSPDHTLASAEAALAFLRSPDPQARYRIDPDEVALWGESLGGWTALSLAAADPSVECVAAGIVANLGELGRQWSASEPYRAGWEGSLRETEANYPVRLEGGPEGIQSVIMDRSAAYDLVPLAPLLSDRTVFMFGAEEDETVPLADHYQPVADALEATGMSTLTLVTSPGGHVDAHIDPSPERMAGMVQWLGEDCFGDS